MNQDQMKIITKVINRIAPKYTFGFYELDDIKQESYIICLEAMERYDPTKPLENFISKVLSNKLKNLVRDKYFRNSSSEDKKLLMDLGVSLQDITPPEYDQDIENKISTQEALEKIMSELPTAYRNDFLRIANGVNIQSHRKNLLFDKIRSILNEDW